MMDFFDKFTLVLLIWGAVGIAVSTWPDLPTHLARRFWIATAAAFAGASVSFLFS